MLGAQDVGRPADSEDEGRIADTRKCPFAHVVMSTTLVGVGGPDQTAFELLDGDQAVRKPRKRTGPSVRFCDRSRSATHSSCSTDTSCRAMAYTASSSIVEYSCTTWLRKPTMRRAWEMRGRDLRIAAGQRRHGLTDDDELALHRRADRTPWRGRSRGRHREHLGDRVARVDHVSELGSGATRHRAAAACARCRARCSGSSRHRP